MNLKITRTAPDGAVAQFRSTVQRSEHGGRWYVLVIDLDGNLLESQGPFVTRAGAERAQLAPIGEAKTLVPLTSEGADLVRRARHARREK
jgi:hypothetical protein